MRNSLGQSRLTVAVPFGFLNLVATTNTGSRIGTKRVEATNAPTNEAAS
jgi:hypothetical protein